MFKIKTISFSAAVTGYTDKRVDISMEGYTPIAILGWSTGNVACHTIGLNIEGNTLFTQYSSSAPYTLEFIYPILYVKNDYITQT